MLAQHAQIGGIEFAIARVIGSVSLFADSIDFLEDASVNLLIAVALVLGGFPAYALLRRRYGGPNGAA